MEAGSAAPRVDWPVYPRRAEHNTVAEGGNRRWAETARQSAASALKTADRRTHYSGARVLEERASAVARRVCGEAWRCGALARSRGRKAGLRLCGSRGPGARFQRQNAAMAVSIQGLRRAVEDANAVVPQARRVPSLGQRDKLGEALSIRA